jgi:Flp pilus assembly protein TadG
VCYQSPKYFTIFKRRQKKMKQLRSEKGQTIVLMAFVMVGLIALVGLALDGGNLFLQRRQVQNAVDASAMAGTRILAQAICNEPSIGDAKIAEAVYGFAESNGIDNPQENVTATYINFDLQNLGTVGSGSIPVGATGISVDVSAEEDTYFIRLVGIDSFSVNAQAAAMTSPPSPGSPVSGIRPVAVPLDVLNYVGVGDELTFQFGNKCNDGTSCAVSWTAHGGGTQSHRGWVALGWAFNQGEDPDYPRTVIKNVSNPTSRTGWRTATTPTPPMLTPSAACTATLFTPAPVSANPPSPRLLWATSSSCRSLTTLSSTMTSPPPRAPKQPVTTFITWLALSASG